MFTFFKKNKSFIREYKNSLPKDLCQTIIEKFERDARKAPGVTVCGYDPETKKTTDLFISNLEDWKDIDKKLYNYLQDGIKLYIKEFYNINKDFYDTGYNIKKVNINEGFYHWHNDSSRREKRFLTFMWYLNDVRSGGETEFFYQGVKIKPEAGKLVFFPSYWTHLHRGNKPLSSDKYIITGWLQFDYK